MIKKIKHIATFVLCLAIGFESIHLAFWLMNRPSTPLFWLGILVLTGIASIAGSYIWKKIGDWLDKLEKSKEETNKQ